MKRGLFIPAEILDDKTLSLQEKFLLAKIIEFERHGKPCFLSNDALCDLLGLKYSQAREILYSLIRRGVLEREGFDGKKRTIRLVKTAGKSAGSMPENQQAECRKSGRQSAEKSAHNISKLTPSTKDNKINDRRQAANQPTIEEREEAFRESVNAYADTWQRSLLDEFIDYWTEHGKGDKKMRFEKQSSFDTSRRLARWDKNDVDKGRPSRKIVSSRPDTRPTMGLKIL